MNRSQVGDDTVNCQNVVVFKLFPHVHFVLIALYNTLMIVESCKRRLRHTLVILLAFVGSVILRKVLSATLEVSVIQLRSIVKDQLTFSPNISPSQMSLYVPEHIGMDPLTFLT